MTASADPPQMPPPASRYNRLSHQTAETAEPVYTVDTAIDTIGLGPFQYIVLALAGLCWTAESMEMLLLSFIKQPLQCVWNISDSQAAFITTSVAFGMLLGATAWGVIADKFGRRTSFITSTAFTFVLGIVSALSTNYWMMVVSRGLVGFGIGGVPVAFSLLMEFLPSAQRGSWGLGLALFWALGAMFEAGVAMFVLPAWGWRWLIAVSTLPLLSVLMFSFWLSESPRWHISRGKVEQAQRTLARVARINRSSLPTGHLTAESTNTVDEAATRLRPDGPRTSRDALVVDVGASSTSAADSSSNDGARSVDIAADGLENGMHHGGQSGAAGRTASNDDLSAFETSVDGQPLQRSRSGIRSLLRPGVRNLAMHVCCIWFMSAFVYYGLVMLQPELISAENEGKRCKYAQRECEAITDAAKCDADKICTWGGTNGTCGLQQTPVRQILIRQNASEGAPENICARELTRDDFLATLWASAGEMPGVLIAFVFVDVVGRRPLLGYMFASLVVSVTLLVWCISRLGETAAFFVARGAAAGVFQLAFLVTNELYPAIIRATAMGTASSVARVGLIVTPFVAQYLFNITPNLAFIFYASASGVALASTVLLPVETTGRPFPSSMDELVQDLREARLRRNEPDTVSFANDPGANKVTRFLRWRAILDGPAMG